MFYFSSDDIELAGASPETLAKLDRGQLSTFPLAGTRPAWQGPDRRMRIWSEELLADEKERAEHNMLVDLGQKRYRKNQQNRDRAGGKIYGDRALFPRYAHRFDGYRT